METDDDLIDGIMTFEEETDGITVAVQSYYLEDQSEPEEQQYFWAYRVRIRNRSGQSVQLLDRHWVIADSAGHTEEVTGIGVVGEQPIIESGDEYIYTSGAPLRTPSGFMHGTYGMLDAEGRTFSIAIPAFSLDCPDTYPLH